MLAANLACVSWEKTGKGGALFSLKAPEKQGKTAAATPGAAVFRFNPAGAVYFICEPSKLFMATGRRV